VRLLAAGEERSRATRRLLARYHPSQSGASVANPALQWCAAQPAFLHSTHAHICVCVPRRLS
jgi:hypothetical protein